jgi:tetratricopeptide (TPR) repeat protein
MACGRTIRRAFALGLAAFATAFAAPSSSVAEPAKSDVKVNVGGGYARLIFSVRDDVDATARMAGNVLIISFSQPTAAGIDRLSAQAPEYIGAARRDPDGRAVRMAIERKVKLNSIRAGEKFFVDLLPDTWTGEPPGLPQDVVEELARRAREGERLQRLARQSAMAKKPAPVLVRVASQPTFMRYVFDVPDQTAVTADRAKDRLTLTFEAPITFDLADAEATLPASVASINAEVEQDTTLVRFGFISKVDVRTFRDGKSYNVDVVIPDQKSEMHGGGAGKPPPTVALESASSEKAPVEGAASRAVAAAAAVFAENPKVAAPATIPAETRAASGAPVPADAPPRPRAPAMISPQEAKAPPPEAKLPPQPEGKPASQEVSQEVKPVPAAAVAQSSAATVAPTKPELKSPSREAKPVAQDEMPPLQEAKPVAEEAKLPSREAKPVAQDTKPVSPPAASAEPKGAEDSPAPPRQSATAPPAGAKAGGAVAVDLLREGPNLKLSFPFGTPTAAAVFMRADILWVVFDTKFSIDVSALDGDPSRTIRGAELIHSADAAIVRIRLDRPHLSSVTAEGAGWAITIGDAVFSRTRPLELVRNMIGANHASVAIPFDDPHQRHRLRDPDTGDDLFVVTGFAPIRGFINEQDFVEFHVVASTQGVAVEPLADDVNVEIARDKVIVTRPAGLTLSSSLHSVLRGSGLRPAMFDSQLWGFDRESTYLERQTHLIDAASAAPPGKRLLPELDLARFYIARDMYPEAKGVLDVALSDDQKAKGDVTASVLRAVTEVMMNRPDDALKDLSAPAIGDQHDAPLWRALAYACQGKWAQARESFKRVEATIATLPIELQRTALKDEMRAAIEVGDFATASDQLNDLQTIGLPRELQPAMSVLIGRLSEGMGRKEDAVAAYQTAADSWDRPAAAQGKLREVALRYALGDLKREEVISQLETLTTVWRGDETEVEALKVLARLYTEEGRYRDSFYVMRSAMAAHPNSDMTRRIEDEAAATFEALFLSGKGDGLPAIDALALFYDFRELTPIGRRGDEMIRRLADRLVSVDLLDQAAELLQYQVDRRLQGAARAQVATRLAVIYLINRKPDRALATLQGSRSGDLANELRNQRLLLEARALSDLGKHDLALEVVARLEGREVIRLRSDILWAARRWGPAAEQLELYYGERWKDWQPLNEIERSDILRAATGYALGEDSLGLSRFREKYAAKMAQTPDARDFEVVSAPLGTSGAEFRNIAHAAASVDTLEGFLRDMRARYPEASPLPPAPAAQPSAPTSAAPPQTRPATTGSVPTPSAPSAPAKPRTAQR